MNYFKSMIAGVFYPATKDKLSETLDSLFIDAEKLDSNKNIDSNQFVKAIITPHAGYIYSGKGAAKAYSKLKNIYKKVVLIGDSHYILFRGVTTYPSDGIETPLGKVEFIKPPLKIENIPHAFYKEHTLDVQIPFLQKKLTDFKIIPILIGDSNYESIGDSLLELSNDSETLFVISTDLSHFLDYDRATISDKNVAQKIINLSPEKLKRDELCGISAVRTILYIAKKNGWSCENLTLFNSGDITNDKSRVVGYGSWIFYDK